MFRIRPILPLAVFAVFAFQPWPLEQNVFGQTTPSQTPTASLPSKKKAAPPKKSSAPVRTAVRRPASSSGTAKPATNNDAAEAALWETVKDSDDPQDFKDYLAKFPNGAYATAANIKLRRLEAKANAETAKPNNAGTAPVDPKPAGANSATESAAKAYADQGDQLSASGKPEDAEIEYQLAVRTDPTNAAWHVKLGQNLMYRKNSEAEAQLREAVRLDPDNVDAHQYLSYALRSENRPDDAEAELREALIVAKKASGLKPNDADLQSKIGRVLMSMRKYDQAEAPFREALRLDPSNAARYSELAHCLEDQQKFTDAEAAFHQAIRIDPSISSIHVSLAGLFNRQARYGEAESEYREAIRLDPKIPYYYNSLGYSLISANKLAEAEAAFRDGLVQVPTQAFLHDSLAEVLGKEGKYPEAEAEQNQAINLEPNISRWRDRFGLMLKQEKKYPEAATAFRNALAVATTDANRSYLHAEIASDLGWQGQWKDSEAEAREAIRLNASNAWAHLLLGIALELVDDGQAEAEMREALRLDTGYQNNGFWHQELGNTIFNRHQYSQAETEYREAVRLDPQNAGYQANLKKVLDAEKNGPGAPASSGGAALNLSSATIHVLYRNKEGVNRIDDANKIAARLKSYGATVTVSESNYKDFKNSLFHRKDQADVALRIAAAVADLQTLKLNDSFTKGFEAGRFELYLQ